MSNRKPTKKRARPRKKKSFLQRLRREHEFRPDAPRISLPKLFHLTNLQRRSLLKWSLYAAVCLVCLLVQDVIMSRAHIFGATTDLVVCAVFLITVIEGTDAGSLFVLIAALFYFFSGSSPGAFSVALLSILGIGAALFRQAFWHRNGRSIILCAGCAVMAYELSVFTAGLFLELTHFGRLGVFLLTGLLSWILLLPLYPLIDRIGRIGGTEWKE